MTMADPSAQLLTYRPVGWANRLVWEPKKLLQLESSVLKSRVANPSHSILTKRTKRDAVSKKNQAENIVNKKNNKLKEARANDKLEKKNGIVYQHKVLRYSYNQSTQFEKTGSIDSYLIPLGHPNFKLSCET